MHTELPPISFSGTLSSAHLEQGLALRRKLIPNSDIVLLPFAAVLFLVLVAVAVAQNPARLWAALLVLLLLLLYLWLSRKFTPLLARETWAGASNMHGARSGVIYDAGVKINFPHGEARYGWDYYACYAASAEMVILLAGATSFHLFPRAFFRSEEEWQLFHVYLQKHLSDAPPPEWRPRYARLNALWVVFLFLVLFGGLALLFSL